MKKPEKIKIIIEKIWSPLNEENYQVEIFFDGKKQENIDCEVTYKISNKDFSY